VDKIYAYEIPRRPLGTIRVLVTDDPAGRAEPTPGSAGPWHPARRRTEAMRVATVTDVTYASGNRHTRYYLTTDIGQVNGLTHNRSFFLAPVPEVSR
jgi:hypothetical protein